jgi:NitT/TauT family transport system ATP-binding protein
MRVTADANHKKSIKINIEDLYFSYSGSNETEVNVLAGLNLQVCDKEFLSIVGASGCGKSTVMNIMAGLLSPTRGRILLDGKPIKGPGPDRTMVFQDDAVFPWYTVKENVEYGLKMTMRDKKEREKEVANTLNLVGLSENASMYPRQLSGGMRKRVDVARAIITKPKVLLMDEPFAALDVMTKQKLQEQFLNIWNETQMTVIFVTHDLEEALYMADRVVVMSTHPGKIACVVDIPFGRPRDKDLKTSTEFARMRRELGHVLDENQPSAE